jgi:4-hydroxy-tetrahydrodipicolinate synthase
VLGKIADEARLPMVPVSEKTKLVVRDAMRHAGLIN